jgi:hypothetical protein
MTFRTGSGLTTVELRNCRQNHNIGWLVGQFVLSITELNISVKILFGVWGGAYAPTALDPPL